MRLRCFLFVVTAVLPWFIRRRLLNFFLGYQIHPLASISKFSFVVPERLVMMPYSSIGAFTVVIHVHEVLMGANSSIGRSNWITAYKRGGGRHFAHKTNREPSLALGAHSAITKKHIIDCTDKITIGDYTTIAGYGSQLITHGIDVELGRQDCNSICIGSYCLIGTCSIFLPGSVVPHKCVIGAGSVVNKAYIEACALYAGVPAVRRKDIPEMSAYFTRVVGYVD